MWFILLSIASSWCVIGFMLWYERFVEVLENQNLNPSLIDLIALVAHLGLGPLVLVVRRFN